MSITPSSQLSSVLDSSVILHPSLLVAPSLQSAPVPGKSIAFIDAGVVDHQTLVAGLSGGTEVVVLNGGDAISQITQTLLNRQGIASVQIISHGINGGLLLGSSWLYAETLPSYVNQLKSWSSALTDDADILLYGCNVAQDATGKAFVNLLAQATGADVAASDDLTGSAALHGNWDLEFRTGQINDGLAASMNRSTYADVLEIKATQFTNLNTSGSQAPAQVPGNLVSLNDTLFFTVTTPTGTELRYKSLSGNNYDPVIPVYLNNFGPNSTVSNLVVIKDTLYFTVQGNGITNLMQMVTDKTSNMNGGIGNFYPPTLINGWQPGTANVSQVTQADGKLFFVANNQLHYILPTNYENIIGADQNQYYGTSVKPVFGGNGNVSQVVNVAGTLYFTVTDGSSTTLKRAITIPSSFNSGSNNGPDMEAQSISSPPLSNLSNFQMVGTKLYFTATGPQGNELFCIQNGQNFVQPLGDLNPGLANASPSHLTNVNGTLYFIAAGPLGRQLWQIGTNNNPPMMVPSNYGLTELSNLINVEGTLYFTAQNPNGDRQVWRYNPTSSNNFAPIIPYYSNNNVQVIDLAYADGQIYFTGTEGSSTIRKLYVAQHNPSGFAYADNVILSSFGSPTSVENFTVVNGSLYLTTSDSIGNTNIWKSRQPTPYFNPNNLMQGLGWLPVMQAMPPNGAIGRVLSNWTVVDNKVLFIADQFNQGKEIIAVSSSAPYLYLNSGIDYQENGAPVLIANNGNVSNLAPGSRITIRMQSGNYSGDRFTIVPTPNKYEAITLDGNMIKFQNESVATFTGGVGRDLVITFIPNKPLPPNAAAAILRQIAYSNTSEQISSSGGPMSRIEVFIQDGEGGTARQAMFMSMRGQDDAPIVGIRKDFPIGYSSDWVVIGPPGTVMPSMNTEINTTSNLQVQAGLSIKTDELPTGYLPSPNDPRSHTISMEAAAGFLVNFEMELLQEMQGSNVDRNLDGFTDEAGFSLRVVSQDPTKAIELSFLGNRIWAKENDGLGTQAEGVGFNTRRRMPYTLAVKGENYTLFANGQAVLNGSLRNYSHVNGPSGSNPYSVGNTIFFGDASTAASASVRVGQVSVAGIPIVAETVIDASSAAPSPNPYWRQVGQLSGFDIDTTNSYYGVINPFVNVQLAYAPNSQFRQSNRDLLATHLDFEAQTSHNIAIQGDGYYPNEQPMLTVRVRNLDDLAILQVPSSQTMLEDGVLTFNTANQNLIRITDADQSLNPIEVKVFGIGGQLSTTAAIPNNVIVNWSRSGNNSEMTLIGSLSDINTALNGLTYRPVPNANSANSAMVGINHSVAVELRESNGNPYLSSSITRGQIGVQINAVNDAPDFVSGGNLVVTSGSSVQTIANWISSFQGSTNNFAWDEIAQTALAYEIVSNDRPDLFDGAIMIDPAGNLTFKPTTDLALGGVATIGVRVRDNGGTANGGIDTSAVKTFNITVNPAPSAWTIVSRADFNGDGKTDIFWRNQTTGANRIWTMDGSNILSAANIFTVNSEFQVAGVADFNGDGKADIFWRSQTMGANSIWMMNGSNVLSASAITSVNIGFQVAGIADFNGDGKADIFWRNQTSGANSIWTMDGHTTLSAARITSANAEFRVAAIADFNGDGKADIFWRSQTTGANSIWTMNGQTILNAAAIATVNNDFQVAGIADFNGDGKADIFWRNQTTGANSIWTMNGHTVSSAASISTVNSDFQVAGVADFNGDGKADIFWRSQTTGANSIWTMNGSNILSTVAISSANVRFQPNRIADFNGDGKADIFWRNQTTGANSIWTVDENLQMILTALPSFV